jgi:hypothetical protein
MAFQDTLAFLSLNEFGVSYTLGATFDSIADFDLAATLDSLSPIEAVGILDSPVEVLAGGMALSREYSLLAKTSDVSTAARGTFITVDSVSYTIRENRAIDDGVFSELLLSKV